MCRLNAGALGWRSAMAAALAHAVARHQKKRLHSISQEDVISFLSSLDSHCAIEAHLPKIVSLAHFTERVIVPMRDFDQLTDAERLRLEELFGDRVAVVENTWSQADILLHSFSALEEKPEDGFRIMVLDRFRELRAVRPRHPHQCQVIMNVAGSCQLLLGSKSTAGLAIVIGQMPSGLEPIQSFVNENGFVRGCKIQELSATAELQQDQSLGASVPAWLVCEHLVPQVCTFRLTEVEGLVKLRVAVTNCSVLVSDRNSQTSQGEWTLQQCLQMTMVAVKSTGTDAEISSLKVM